MKRGQVFVRGRDPNGKWGAIDVLDLDEPSFRAFVMEMFKRAQIVVALKDESVEGDHIEYHGCRKLVENSLDPSQG